MNEHIRPGFLSQYFDGVAIKRLSAVEADPSRSNQHEFNGTVALKNLLGTNKLENYPARFMWLGGENEGITVDSSVTWYDSRERHPKRSEWRLYFKGNAVMDMASAGDLLVVAKRPNGDLYLLIAPAGSTIEQQLVWLFDVGKDIGDSFSFKNIQGKNDVEIDYIVRYVLEELGIEVQDHDTGILDTHLEPFIESNQFPSTKEFSELARRISRDVSPVEDPDHALLTWMDIEERLFRRLEKHFIKIKLASNVFWKGSEVDVDGFIEFSLKIINRRKSRVGYALENHLEEIFRANNIKYSRNKVTELKSRPDFLFPGISYYHDESFPVERLTVLGVKSTCKDRWRQVLSEAKRIREKHLFTLEPGISENQTEEMKSNSLQLVLPKKLHDTYKPSQRDWLMSLNQFVQLVKARQ